MPDRNPLVGKTAEARESESSERDQLLLDRITARRQEVVAEDRVAKEKRKTQTQIGQHQQ